MRLTFKLFIYDFVTYREALEEPILWKYLGGQCILKTLKTICIGDSRALL